MNARFRLLAIMVVIAALSACGNNEPPKPVAVSEICQLESGTMVVAEGRLGLPLLGLTCRNGECRINFADDSGSVQAEFTASKEPSAGKLTLPPQQYTLDDLQVTLRDGTLADRSTTVKITGPVRKQGTNCYLDAYVAELPQRVGEETP
jgi:hypothetical protein